MNIRADGYVPELNPPDASALEVSLKIKEKFADTHIILIHLGPASGERWLREGLAYGCDAGLRIWEKELDGVQAPAKALVFARVAEILGFDLIITGNRSQDTASGQVGILLAGHLNLPYISSVLDVELEGKERAIVCQKALGKGSQERVRCSLPLVATIEAQVHSGRYASFPALLEAMEKEIPCWDLSQLGIPRDTLCQKNSLLNFEPLRFPKPRLKKIPAPDSSLSAFERILKLLEGTVRRRGGKVVAEDEDSVVEELFQTLRKEGWLDHLREKGI